MRRGTRAFSACVEAPSGTRADWAFAFGPQNLARSQPPQPGPDASSRPSLGESGWARVPSKPALRRPEVQPGPGFSSESQDPEERHSGLL